MTIDRIPPSSLEAEQAVLGSLLVDREMLEAVRPLLDSRHFYSVIHALIYTAILRLADRGSPFDKITLAEDLRARGELEKVGGIVALTTLMDTVPTAASAEFYARIVREKAVLRGLISAGTKISQLGYESEDDVPFALGEADRYLRALVERGPVRVVESELTGVVASRLFDAMDAAIDPTFCGVAGEKAQQTPWAAVNESTGGFYPGELVAWPSAPAMGKSGAVSTLASFLAGRYGGVGIFPLEMGKENTTRRLIAMHSCVTTRRQRLATDLRPADFERIGAAVGWLRALPLYIFERRHKSLADIRQALKAHAATDSPLRAIVIDHVNFLLEANESRERSTKHERLDRVYRELLDLAEEFRVVVHAVQHVNREGMKGRPTLADIRDGGNIEGHAHAIIFPFRAHPTGSDVERREAEFIIAKVRDGEPQTCPMQFLGWRHLYLDDHDSAPWFEVESMRAHTPTLFEATA
jgi:replicative DNA helicase